MAFVRVPEGGKIGRDFPDSGLVAGDWVAGNTGDIAVMRFENGAFQPALTVVSSTPGVEYHYYPTFSPGSDFVAFVSASAPGQSPYAWPMIYGRGAMAPPEYRDYVMTYGQASTRLRLVALDAGGPARDPVDLTAATHLEGCSAASPRFLPVQQGDLAFLGFSARLPYGVVIERGTVSQLWLAAIDLARARSPGGADPSFPPVWLPYQEPRVETYGAAWAIAGACTNNGHCRGGFVCQDGTCGPPPGPAVLPDADPR